MKSIVYYTLLELHRERVYLFTFLMGFFIALVSLLGSSLSYQVGQMVTLDIGLGVLTLLMVGQAIYFGVTMVGEDLAYKTLYMVLQRVKKRRDYLLGKTIALLLLLFFNLLVLGLVIYFLASYEGGMKIDLYLFSLMGIFFESTIILFASVNLTLYFSRTISLMIAICIYFIGHSLHSALEIIEKKGSFLEVFFLKGVFFVWPDFHLFNLKQYVLYEQFLPENFLSRAFAYGLCYCFFLLCLMVIRFEKKQLD